MLTTVLSETLVCIHQFQSRYDISPSIRYLSRELNLGPSTVVGRRNRLKVLGFIDYLPGKMRTIRLMPGAIAHLIELGEYHGISSVKKQIPLLGEIAAGYLSQPATNPESVELEDFDPDRDFGLRVSGDSMVNVGILDGFIAIFKRVPDGYEPKAGEIVAAYVEGFGTTLKRFYRDGWNVRLEAANPEYSLPPIDTRETFVRIDGTWSKMTIANV
jgi:repressor LexA